MTTSNNPQNANLSYLFVHEGQSVPIEAHISQDEALLKRLVSTWAPAAKTGTLDYSEPDGNNTVTITLTTRAQPKGLQVVAADPLTALLEAEGGENPVLVLYRNLNALYAQATTPAEILVTQAEIEAALETGQRENKLLEDILARLQQAAAAEAPHVLPFWS